MSLWKIAAVQMDCRLADVAHNVATIRSALRQAANAGARLVICPECALSGYCFTSRDEALPHAEPLPGPSTQLLLEECARLNVWLVAGMLERDGDRLFNAAALLGPNGQATSYRKVHLPCLGIDRFVDPGDRPFAVHDLGGLRIGITICYDGSFPEASRVLALAGADLIVLPTNWPEDGRRAATYLPAARALENRVYYAAVNRVGEERGFRFIGHSKILDCTGDLLAGCDAPCETILYADIDPERARRKRIVNIPGVYEVDRIADRRPDMYAPIAQRRA